MPCLRCPGSAEVIQCAGRTCFFVEQVAYVSTGAFWKLRTATMWNGWLPDGMMHGQETKAAGLACVPPLLSQSLPNKVSLQLRYRVNRSKDCSRLEQRATGTDWNWINQPRSATSRTIVTKCIAAFRGWIDAHVVWKERDVCEEVCSGTNRLRERAGRVSVTFEFDVFEIKWFMT